MRKHHHMLMWVILAAQAIFNVYASLVIVRSPLATPSQKVAQTLVVWLVPVLGALIVLAIHKQPPAKHQNSSDVSNEERFPGLFTSYDVTTHTTDHDTHMS
jgi:hypothetical protein